MGAKGITITKERIKICPQCGIEFKCPFGTGIGVWRNRIFCTMKCFGLSRRSRKSKNCVFCGKEFTTTYERIKYCSKQCVDTDPNAKKRRRGVDNPNYNRIEKHCEVCGNIFLVIPARLQSAKCSRECAKLWQSITRSGEDSPSWNGGTSFEDYSFEFNNLLKSRIRERDNNKCVICGKSRVDLGYNPPVHHIDYNKMNSSPKNLVTLCRSCHTATNHNREKWLEYFKEREFNYDRT